MDGRAKTSDRRREPRAGSNRNRSRPKYRISSGQLYTWRQQLMSLPGSVVTRAPMHFAAVDLATGASPSPEPPTPVAPPSAAHADGLIEIVLPSGVSLRVDAHVDGRALRRVLGALEGR